MIIGSGVNLRSNPSTSRGTVLAKLDLNAEVTVISTVGNYYAVAVDGQQGYVLKNYVRITSTGTSSGSSSSGSATVQGYGVTTGSVNFRKGPGTGYAILTKLSKGTELTIYSQSNGWYYVSANGQTGYVSGDYVRQTQSGSSSTDTSSPSSSTEGAGVTTGSVNLRSGPSTGYTILARLSKGTELTIYGNSNGWYSVNANGKTGYVSGDYVKVTSTGSTGTSAGTSTTGTTWSGVVVNEWVRMRSSTDLTTQSNIVGTYDVGTQVTILGQTGNFYLVTVEGKQGYMHKDYVQVTGENASTISGVTTANVYLRQGPGSGYSVLTTLAKGTTLVILGSSGDYYQAQAGSYTGYLVKKYVSVQ